MSDEDFYEPGSPFKVHPDDLIVHGRRWRRERDEARAERDRLRDALAYLADPESWAGDPLKHATTLYGHDTPYELAKRALGGGS
jgi:hypothetical protein